MRRVCFVMAVCTGLLVALYVLAVCTTAGQRFDDSALHGPVGDSQRAAADLLNTVTAWTVTPTVLVVGGLGWRRGGRPLGLAVTGMILMSIGTVYWLQHVLPRPSLSPDSHGASFPSGHAAVATAVLCGLMMIVPDRFRDAAAVPASLGMSAMAALTVLARWHRPSDTVGSALIVLVFAGAATAFLTRHGRVRSEPVRPLVVVVLGAQVLVAVGFAVFGRAGIAITSAGSGMTALTMLVLIRRSNGTTRRAPGGPPESPKGKTIPAQLRD